MATSKQQKVYRAHVDGFFGDFVSLDDLRAWAISRRDRWGCAGKVMSIMQGVRHGAADAVDVYAANCPRREIVL